MITVRKCTFAFPVWVAGLLIIGMVFLNSCNNEKGQQESGNVQNLQEQNETSQYTAQHLRDACLKGQVNEVNKMIEQGIDVNASDEGGRTPLMLASFNGHSEVARILLDKGARVGDQNAEGRTPLIFAASGPFPETVELLLEQGADPNTADEVDGWTALMFAAAEGNEEVVQILLAHDADPSISDKDGESALDFAENNGHTEIVQLLESP